MNLRQPTQSPDSQTRRALWAVAIGLAVALAGSGFGLVGGVILGPVSGPEAWLIASCVLVSGALLGLLARKPDTATSSISMLASLYFLVYLCAGVILSLSHTGELLRALPYLLWFYPLMAFSQFTNFGRHAALVHAALTFAPPVLLIAFMAISPKLLDSSHLGPTIVFLLSFVAYASLLKMYARNREDFVINLTRAEDLQQASNVLRESEERFRRLFNESKTGMGALDSTGRIRSANESFLSAIGFTTLNELLHFSACLHEDDRQIWLAKLSAMTSSGKHKFAFEGRLIDRQGRLTWIEGNFAYSPATDRLEETIIFVCHDVTEQRELRARLRQSQKLEAIGQLTGGIAHDFNNLLTVILGNSATLADSLADHPRLRELADLTVMAAERGADLTSRLLAVGRRQVLDPVSIDLNRQIALIDPLLRRALGAQVEVEFVRAAGVWPALADSGQLESAILNLCLNARDAMPGGGKLTIETANIHFDDSYAEMNIDIEPGQYVMIAISDTGSGMSAETQARAFEPFFTTKDVGKGSGLGLSMVYGFARQSRGYVKIYSELGQGTTVRLYLPRAYEHAIASPPLKDQVATPGGHEWILLVEDDDLVRAHVTAQLAALGYQIVAVKNGAAAIAALNETTFSETAGFDLLFTDVVMPGGMNGPQLAEAARTLRPGLPVLFTSGYTENAVVHHGRLDRGVQLLQKPYRAQDLALKIRRVLDQEKTLRKT